MKTLIVPLLAQAFKAVSQSDQVSHQQIDQSIERTRSADHGDFASNIAMIMAKKLSMNPRQLATCLLEHLPSHPFIQKVEIAGPGFINFTFNLEAYYQEILNIIKHQNAYGSHNYGQNEAVQIEFVSANPTGPLHVGHGRGAAIGDSLARILKATGFKVHKEFYYNDAGAQIDNLTASVKARLDGLSPGDENWPAQGYCGEYIADIAEHFRKKSCIESDGHLIEASGNIENLTDIRQFAVAYLRKEQDLDLKAFSVEFDEYYLESSLYTEGKVQAVVQRLTEQQHTFEQEGALWLKTTDFGDDKDRVMRKSDGSYTYFVPDVAYHQTKWQRGFTTVINEQGADHHGTIARVRAGLQALNIGIPNNWPEYVLHQMVMVMRNGQEVKLSKRAGDYVTLRDLIDEVGKDATRFFLVARKSDSQLQFDIDLARAQSNDNPVYYIQYAHARLCSVLKNASFSVSPQPMDVLPQLTHPHEIEVLRYLSRYPEIVLTAAKQRSPHLIANYLQELAALTHAYYVACKFLVEDETLQQARLTLVYAIRIVLANGLDLIGVSAPEIM